ncbi:hypothetical protein IQ268_12030 [Oculatella sp. LEGE 06141]|uniref:hypothetical protein n=1 Tax=Oculatella sp. LEGE 06141 TaxID=1828648 RepID=UPI0018804B78|nr:hypothetical protein [Oculatella sp. LEGE 06141]MBE9179290.1 hypothetical protein [Oculatella sp. LEGE 06141]
MKELSNSEERDGVLHIGNNEVIVLKNLGFDPTKNRHDASNFPYFQQRVEIFHDESKEAHLGNQIALVKLLLEHLWGNEILAVPVCDFEEYLPKYEHYSSASTMSEFLEGN